MGILFGESLSTNHSSSKGLKLPLSEFSARIFILATITPSPENSGQTAKITAGKRQAGAQS